MTQTSADIIGKKVKDMYGSFVGRVIGTVTDIDGSIQLVGVDHGSRGLVQIKYEQLVVQDDMVIYIPGWRLESQRLIREKQLTLRRLKALMEIVSENDGMRDDAEIIHDKYKAKLVSLDEMEAKIKAQLSNRLSELEDQIQQVKMLLFDAKVQFKSSEIPEETFEIVRSSTSRSIERMTHESAEISSVQSRIADLLIEMPATGIKAEEGQAFIPAPMAPSEEVPMEAPMAPSEEVPMEAPMAPSEEVPMEAPMAPSEEVPMEAPMAPSEEVPMEAPMAPSEEVPMAQHAEDVVGGGPNIIQESAMTYLNSPASSAPQVILPEAPTEPVLTTIPEPPAESTELPEPPKEVSTKEDDKKGSDWLTRMEAQ